MCCVIGCQDVYFSDWTMHITVVSLRGVLYQCSARDQATLSRAIVLILFYRRKSFLLLFVINKKPKCPTSACSLLSSVNRRMFTTFPGMKSSLAKVNRSLGAHFLDAFLVILRFLDVPKYSDMFDKV